MAPPNVELLNPNFITDKNLTENLHLEN